jgi:WD40 repeat protein
MHGASLFDATGKPSCKLIGVGSAPRIIAWSRNGARVAGGNVDGMVQVWDAATGKMVASFEEGDGSVDALDISADGEIVVAGHDGDQVRAWSVSKKKRLAKTPPSSARALAIDPTGKRVAILHKGSVELRELPGLTAV